jgi:hypothetical protein
MRFNLRSLFLAPVVLAAMSFATVAAHAEATLKVPFSFTVNGKDCPAGLYTVNHDALHNLVTLKSKETPQSFTWVVGPGEPNPNATAVTLRFNDQDNNYTLRSVQYGPNITSRLDKKTKHNEHVHVETITGQ